MKYISFQRQAACLRPDGYDLTNRQVLALLLCLSATPALAQDKGTADQHIQIQRIDPQSQPAPDPSVTPGAPDANRDMMIMQNRMNRMFQDFFAQDDMGMPPGMMDFPQGAASFPAIDIAENDKNYVVTIELPGVDPDAVNLSITGNLLTVKGEKQQTSELKDKNYVQHETSYGSFERAVSLPAGADPDKADASFKNGVLTVTFAKKAGAEPETRQLTIHKGS